MKNLINEYLNYWSDCTTSLKKNWKGVAFVLAIFYAIYFGIVAIWWYWNNIIDWFGSLFDKFKKKEKVVDEEE